MKRSWRKPWRRSKPRAEKPRHFALDVASEDAIKSTVKQISAQFGKIDILVNNAGITRDNLLMRMKRADWDDVLTTNLSAPFLLTQAVIGGMLKQRWGRIINITSIVGEMGAAGQANYASSKAGLIGLTLSVAREVASRNITVNAVAPGYIATAMTDVLTEEQKTGNHGADSAGTPGHGFRHRQRRTFSRQQRGGLHHRSRARCERRHVDGLMAARDHGTKVGCGVGRRVTYPAQ